MQHQLNTSEKELIIKQLQLTLQSEGPQLVAAYVYGSFLTGKSFSDIDIALMTASEVANPLDVELKLETRLASVLRIPADVRILNQAPISFSQSVIRHGRVVIDHEPNRRADFESRVLREYFDIKPFRRRYLQEVINAPV